MTPRTLRQIRRQILIYAGLAPFLVIAMFPILWMSITAFEQDADLYRVDVAPFWFHLPPTLEHFTRLFTGTYFTAQLLNTLQLAIYVVALTMLMAVPAGYSLARLKLPGAENLGIAMFLTYLVPPIILFIPLARVVGVLGLFDSWWALVVVYPGFTIPFCTWKMMGYFAFSPSMQEYLYAVAYVAPRAEKVVTVGPATALIRGDIFYWGSLMAGALIVGVPIALLYSLVLDQFIEGLTGAG